MFLAHTHCVPRTIVRFSLRFDMIGGCALARHITPSLSYCHAFDLHGSYVKRDTNMILLAHANVISHIVCSERAARASRSCLSKLRRECGRRLCAHS